MSRPDPRIARLIDLSSRNVDRAQLASADAQRQAEAATGAYLSAEAAYRAAVTEEPAESVDPFDLEAAAARRGYLRSVADHRRREAGVAQQAAEKAMAALVEARIDLAKLEKFGQIRAERADEEERRRETRALDDHAARGARRAHDERESR